MMEIDVKVVRNGKRQKKGRGKRSNARIGPKPKTHGKEKKKDDPKPTVSLPDISLPEGWVDVSNDAETRLCLISRQDYPNAPPIVITRSLIVVKTNGSWMLHVHGHHVDSSLIPTLDETKLLDLSSISSFLQAVSNLNTCIGNPDAKIINLAKRKKNGQFLSLKQDVIAYLDDGLCVYTEDVNYPCTVRSSSCHLLTKEIRCENCIKYRKTLLTLCLRSVTPHDISSTKKNYRFMRTPERLTALRMAKKTLRTRDQRIARMKERLELLTMEKGIEVDSDVHEQIAQVIEDKHQEIQSLPESDFRKTFWDQQVKAMKCKGTKGMRWHPLFIRWCLNLSRVSPKAYEVMRESGIQLPTRRTLNDYTHWVSAKPGFSHEIDMFLQTEAKVNELQDWQRFVVLIIDEMKIHEDLVYDKTGQIIHGFVNLGDMNKDLQALESHVLDGSSPSSSIATHMLTIMVRGIFFKFEFPYASFPTQGVTGHSLYWIMWEAVRRLEEINLKVIVFVCDGAKPNRKFLKSLGTQVHLKNGIAYKTVNRYCQNRFIYFISDVPHLIKTTRNCWYSSSNGGTRCMWNNGKHILWEHLKTLSNETQASSGLYVGRRLTYEHIHLTSFSKMKVNLAAQVLSSSVSAAFKMLNSSEYDETAKFCKMFDRFFDCLNTRNMKEGKHKRKPDLDPYRSSDDKRFVWLEQDFLGYLDDWAKAVQQRVGFTADEKKKMMISQETLDGLRMTVYSFVEMSKFLLSQTRKDGSLFLLSERLNQDPLESFFGQQRARGGRSDNPNARNFLYNAQAIRVQRSMAIGHGGNVRKRKQQWTTDLEDLSRPLKKRRTVLF